MATTLAEPLAAALCPGVAGPLQPPSGSDAESLDRRSVPCCRYVLGVADVTHRPIHMCVVVRALIVAWAGLGARNGHGATPSADTFAPDCFDFF